MPADVVAQKSADMSQQIIDTTDWENAKTVHCFLPLVGDSEPDMRELIQFAIDQGSTVHTSSPSAETGRKVLELDSRDLPEFSLSENIEFDVIIVPMLAYDPATKHRLGFGGGFYDRFLESQKNALKIGVCFSECITKLPVELHDQPLDKTILV